MVCSGNTAYEVINLLSIIDTGLSINKQRNVTFIKVLEVTL